MYKTKDFILMQIHDTSGTNKGVIRDIFVDYYKSQIEGFKISNKEIRKENRFISTDNIIYWDKYMIGEKYQYSINGNSFNSLKGIEVVDLSGNIIGIIEDILFDEDFEIKGYIISTGIIKDFINGKIIILPNMLIIGERSVLVIDNIKKISFRSMPHKIYRR